MFTLKTETKTILLLHIDLKLNTFDSSWQKITNTELKKPEKNEKQRKAKLQINSFQQLHFIIATAQRQSLGVVLC